jgi:hypothetical protein
LLGRRLRAAACQWHLTEAGTGARLATSPTWAPGQEGRMLPQLGRKEAAMAG